MTPEDIPTEQELATWLAQHQHPADWAKHFHGLPWKYIKPVATIAKSTGNHPLVALTGAAAFSSDPAFKAAANAHMVARGAEPAAPGPNRAQRRAAAKQQQGRG